MPPDLGYWPEELLYAADDLWLPLSLAALGVAALVTHLWRRRRGADE